MCFGLTFKMAFFIIRHFDFFDFSDLSPVVVNAKEAAINPQEKTAVARWKTSNQAVCTLLFLGQKVVEYLVGY